MIFSSWGGGQINMKERNFKDYRSMYKQHHMHTQWLQTVRCRPVSPCKGSSGHLWKFGSATGILEENHMRWNTNKIPPIITLRRTHDGAALSTLHAWRLQTSTLRCREMGWLDRPRRHCETADYAQGVTEISTECLSRWRKNCENLQ